MSNNFHEDSTIMKIMEVQEDRGHVDVSLNQSDDVLKDLKEGPSNRKLIEHQNDRYTTKMIGKGMFDETDDDNLYVSQRGVVVNETAHNSHIESSKVEDGDEVFVPSSFVRIGGKQAKLPSLRNLKRAASIGLTNEEELAKITKNSKDLISSPEILRKKTLFKWSQIPNYSQFLKDSIPSYKKLAATLERNRSGFKRFFPLFEMYFNDQNKYIMSSKRICCNSTSRFEMSSHHQSFDGVEFFGVVESNFLGTLYNVYSDGEHNQQRELLATICYQNQVTLTSEPRKMQVYVLSPYYQYSKVKGIDGKKNLKQLYDIQENAENKRILKIVNKKAQWNDKKNIWQMDFHGKMKISSVKNMILVDAENEKKECLMVAKTDEDSFYISIQHPLSPRVGMAIINSSFDFKWVCQ